MKRSAILLLAATLGACGLKEPLQPPLGEGLPPVPLMADDPLTSEELLTPPPIARPERVDELLRRSEVREDDPFDLPPGDVATGAVPIPDPEAREPVDEPER